MRAALVTAIVVLGVLLCLPSAGLASADPLAPAVVRAAEASCRAERQALGAEGFALAHNAGSARAAKTRCAAAENREAEQEADDATARCSAAREVDPEAFAEAHGAAGVPGCAAAAVAAEARDDIAAVGAAARFCRDERAVDAEIFVAKYAPGDRPGLAARALPHCVVATSRARDDEGSDAEGARMIQPVTGSASAV